MLCVNVESRVDCSDDGVDSVLVSTSTRYTSSLGLIHGHGRHVIFGVKTWLSQFIVNCCEQWLGGRALDS